MSWFKKKAQPPKRRKAPAQQSDPNVRPSVSTHKGWQAESVKKQQHLAERLKKDTSPAASPIGKIEAGTIRCATHTYTPEVLIRLFLREDCSWCRKFYTHPTECPSDRYGLEKCDQYEQLDKDSRSSLIETPLWQVVIREAMSKKVSPLPTRKCHYCGKLNPEPEMINHWKCVSCGSKL
jgi:hypothetical protein